jgi:uncharacterized FlaG/YvyC family protein
MSPPLEIQAITPSTPTLPAGPGNGQLASKNLNSSTHPEQQTVPQSTATPRPHEMKNDNKMVELGFSVDHESNALKIKVTNQVSGEVVREFEIKGLNSAHHDPVNSKGVIVDDRT